MPECGVVDSDARRSKRLDSDARRMNCEHGSEPARVIVHAMISEVLHEPMSYIQL